MASTVTHPEGFVTVYQSDNAPTLAYTPESGCKLIEIDGLLFKNLSRTGTLLPYEDWRLTAEERAADLAERMTIEQIAGLMLYSNHQAIPATTYDVSTYDGKPYQDGVTQRWRLTDHQKQFLRDDNVRHVLVATISSPEDMARWNNCVQAYAESLPWGIPVNNSSDPRHSVPSGDEFNVGAVGNISKWPSPLGMAATFSPETVHAFGDAIRREYRAMGFATALSPQVDLATEPRWYRFYGTFGSEPKMATEMARAYCDGIQTTPESKGWGAGSVNAMVKHWPGGGTCESGRDAHFGFGKYAVYPGGCYEQHKLPFINGAFALTEGTSMASAVMPYYTISTGQSDENVGNGYNHHIITDQLRGKAGYNGVVCTDWAVTHDEIHTGRHSGKPWGVETCTVAERHYRALMAGVDQFGGNYDKLPILEAYEMGVKEHGRKWMDRRMRISAKRLLLNMFRTGLFENPYTSAEGANTEVGSLALINAGYSAQLHSCVMLKNRNNTLPLNASVVKLYIPARIRPEHINFWGGKIKRQVINPINDRALHDRFTRVDNPAEADAAVVFIDSPMGGWGYDVDEALEGRGNGYHPISLQYSPYTATAARKESLAGGDPYEDFTNRCYLGKSATTINACDLDLLRATRKAMGDKPVILAINIRNAPVMSEVEPLSDAIFFTFDIENRAIIDLIANRAKPSARLPFQVPASMEAVETHNEDQPLDITPYTDTEGNTYDFGFGLTY